MSAQSAHEDSNDTSIGAEVSATVEMLLEEHETHEAALWALAHDYIVLLADADRSCSRGYLRGMFSEGARPVPEDDA
jgi:hypothetical protein